MTICPTFYPVHYQSAKNSTLDMEMNGRLTNEESTPTGHCSKTLAESLSPCILRVLLTPCRVQGSYTFTTGSELFDETSICHDTSTRSKLIKTIQSHTHQLRLNLKIKSLGGTMDRKTHFESFTHITSINSQSDQGTSSEHPKCPPQ